MSTLSLHKKCLDVIQAEIQGLDLTGIPDASVHVLPVSTNRDTDIADTDRAVDYPCIVIAPYSTEQIGGPENQADDMTYPVCVSIVDKAESAKTNLDRNLYWREQIIDWFHENRFPAIDNSSYTQVQPLSVVNSMAYLKSGLWLSEIIINVTVTKQRRVS